MPTTFRPYTPDQDLLLPPNLREWLAADHVAYFISEVVEELDLSAFYAPYEGDGRRRMPYEPSMMLKVLIYGYVSGVFSSRKIGRKLEEDVAFRVLAAGNFPSHRTICAFRKRHLKDFKTLFVQVVQIAGEAGLVSLGTLAVDGTKVRANASKHKAMSYRRMLEAALGGLLGFGGGGYTSERLTYQGSVALSVRHPLLLGGALAGASPELLAAYSAFGLPLGEAFQLRDDVLGVFGDPSQTGKPAGDDLREGKRTMPVAIAIRNSTPAQGASLRRHLGDPRLDAASVEELRRVIVETGALTEVERLIDSLVDEASGTSYYLAKVEVPPEELAKLGEGVSITPGMPAEVMIMSAERTLVQYLVQPLMDSLRRTFRES